MLPDVLYGLPPADGFWDLREPETFRRKLQAEETDRQNKTNGILEHKPPVARSRSVRMEPTSRRTCIRSLGGPRLRGETGIDLPDRSG